MPRYNSATIRLSSSVRTKYCSRGYTQPQL
jgi:hypothetical protein